MLPLETPLGQIEGSQSRSTNTQALQHRLTESFGKVGDEVAVYEGAVNVMGRGEVVGVQIRGGSWFAR